MMRRTALKRTSSIARRGTVKRPKQKPPLSVTEVRLALEFHDETLRYMPRCAVCGYDGLHLEAHHVIPQSVIRYEMRRVGREATFAALFDVRNGMTLCAEPAPNRCHNRHTNAVQRVPRSKLRPAHYEFAADLNRLTGDERFTVRLEQMYPVGS